MVYMMSSANCTYVMCNAWKRLHDIVRIVGAHAQSSTHIVIAEDSGSVSGSSACDGIIAGRNGVDGERALVGSR